MCGNGTGNTNVRTFMCKIPAAFQGLFRRIKMLPQIEMGEVAVATRKEYNSTIIVMTG